MVDIIFDDDESEIDADSVSSQSTAQADSDPEREWVVKQVLAEGFDSKGVRKYLIEWEGFPLKDATWEPSENFTSSFTLEDWEQTKIGQENGSLPKFKIKKWRDAFEGNFRARLARHNRRNQKRARRGLDETAWDIDLPGFLEYADSFPKDEDMDANRDNTHVDGVPRDAPVITNSTTSGATYPSAIGHETAVEVQESVQFSSPEGSVPPPPDSRNTVQAITTSSMREPAPPRQIGPKKAKALKDAKSPGQRSVEKSSKSTSSSIPVARPGLSVTQPQRPQQPQQPRQTLSKRTAQPTARASGNVFAAGKHFKRRPTLLDAASDSTKEPKLFNQHLTRKLEINRRNKEGTQAPAQEPQALYSLDRNNPQTILRKEPAIPDQANDEQEETNLMEVNAPATGSSEEPGKAPDATMHLNLPVKKTVRWAEEPTEFSRESSLFIREQSFKPPEKLEETVANPWDSEDNALVPEPMSIDGDLTAKQAVRKLVQLGKDSLQFMSLTFEGIFAGTDLAWVGEFENTSRLVFTHLCMAQDFEVNSDIILKRKLCEGTVFSATNPVSLDNLRGQLKFGSRGVFCCNPVFGLLLFPSDWSLVGSALTIDPTHTGLQYLIFEPQASFLESLSPIAFSNILKQPRETSLLYSRPFEHIFGPRYRELTPRLAEKSARHCFCLVFPSLVVQEAYMLARWLRAVHPTCDIRLSHSAGAWSSFLKLSQGVVLIHEDAFAVIRAIPHLSSLLRKPGVNFKFWVFSRSLLPLSTSNDGEIANQSLGDLRLQPVFSLGDAILVTPSFLLAQPEQAYAFLKWFQQKQKRDLNTVLVVHAGVEQWLHDLAIEKASQSGDRLPQRAVNDLGVHEKAMEARAKLTAWFMHFVTLLPLDESSSTFVLAPKCIDGNDEQSLVNWFGFWSLSKLNQFRRFTVLGSSRTTKERLTRRVRIPKYQSDTFSDPDRAEDDYYRQNQTSLAAPLAPLSRDEEATSIEEYLKGLMQSIQKRPSCPISLYFCPISYWHVEMPFRYNDISSKFKTFQNWLTFVGPREANRGLPGMAFLKSNEYCFYNTCVGFFNTVEAKWDPSVTLKHPSRRPWVAILRPCNPHVRPWVRSELFIWDMKYAGKQIMSIDDLPEAQQKLIEHVADYVDNILPLESVWAGGFGASRIAHEKPLDATLKWLDLLLDNVFKWLPAVSNYLSDRGWCLIDPEPSTNGGGGDSPSDLRAKARDACDVNSTIPEKNLKAIFHPPRGNGTQKKSSKCRNLLHQWATETSRTTNAPSSEYVFQPTMEWYADQREEGRGYEHIWVTTWKEAFEEWHIEDPEKDRS